MQPQSPSLYGRELSLKAVRSQVRSLIALECQQHHDGPPERHASLPSQTT